MSDLEAALTALDGLPDSSMAVIAWWRDEAGELQRPCTRDEIRAGLLAGTMNPENVIVMARLAAMTQDQLADLTAKARRQNMRAV